MIDAMKAALEALEHVHRFDQQGLYGLDDEIDLLHQAIAEAEKESPSTSGVIFAVEQAIESGDCPMGIELAYDDYEAKRKEATLQEMSDIGREIEKSTNSTKTVSESNFGYGLQEPVAWMYKDGTTTADPNRADGTWTPLYTAPPKQEQEIFIGTDLTADGMHLVIRRGNEIIHSQFYEAPKREFVGLTDEQTPDDILRQSEREGWRYAKECEAEIKRLKELAEYRLKLLMKIHGNELDAIERGYFAGKEAGIAECEAIAKLRERNN
jgi:hypothetical protein